MADFQTSHPSGVQQAAEEPRETDEFPEEPPTGAEAGFYDQQFAARLKSCPGTKRIGSGVFPQHGGHAPFGASAGRAGERKRVSSIIFGVRP